MTPLATLPKPTPPFPAKPLIEQAKQMAADGLGWEDLMVRLNISRASARAFVLGIGAKR
jgi:hypothetical protein